MFILATIILRHFYYLHLWLSFSMFLSIYFVHNFSLLLSCFLLARSNFLLLMQCLQILSTILYCLLLGLSLLELLRTHSLGSRLTLVQWQFIICSSSACQSPTPHSLSSLSISELCYAAGTRLGFSFIIHPHRFECPVSLNEESKGSKRWKNLAQITGICRISSCWIACF